MPTNAERAALLTGKEARNVALPVQKVELRETDDGTPIFTGVASSTSVRIGKLGDTDSQLVRDNGYDMGWYTERIMAGAFAATLARGPDVQFLVNHGGNPIARTSNGSLVLRENPDHGLTFEATPSDPTMVAVRELASSVRTRLQDQCSFAFRVVRQSWSDDHDVREISQVEMHNGDVSVVNVAANPRTSVNIRALFAELPDLTDGELLELRDDPAIMAVVRSLFVPELTTTTEDLEVRDGLSLDLARARAFALRKSQRRSA